MVTSTFDTEVLDGVATEKEGIQTRLDAAAAAAPARGFLWLPGEESSKSCDAVARVRVELPLADAANGNHASRNALEENRASLARAWRLGLPVSKKLLILDLNGILVACLKKSEHASIPRSAAYKVVTYNYVYKRPFCNAFLDFCFENFHVGVWSSRKEGNVRQILDYIGEGLQQKLMFIMHQGDCTDTGLKNPTNSHQPLFLKELSKVWSRFPNGEFNEANTLLIDDTPYKALLNPPHTAIFLESYTYNELDNFLAEELMEYLAQLRNAANVREFVRMHPIGRPAIAAGCTHWNVYRRVLEKMKEVTGASTPGNLVSRPLVTSTPKALVLEKMIQNLAMR